MNGVVRRLIWLGAVAIVATAAAQPFLPKAGLRDIMAHIVDPAADFVWSSVSATVTEQGTHERQPRSEREWSEVRES